MHSAPPSTVPPTGSEPPAEGAAAARAPDADPEVARLRAELARVERELADARARAHANERLIAALPVFIVRADANDRITYLNRVADPSVPVESVLGTDMFENLSPSAREAAREAIGRARETGLPARYETRALGPDGGEAIYDTWVWPIPEEPGALAFAAQDVTELHRRSQALGERDLTLRLAAEATGLALWTFDLASGAVVWDEAMYALCGTKEPLPPSTYTDIVHPDDLARVQAAIDRTQTTGVFHTEMHRILRPDGEERWTLAMGRVIADEQGVPVKFIGGSLDLTREKQTEETLRASQRMEAVGRLTAGIAHNFNNMLSVILPTLELVERTAAERERRLVRSALEAGERASELVSNMMALAADRRYQRRRVVPLRDVVGHALGICRRVLDPGIQVEEELDATDACASVDVGEIEQVVVNLLLNARDALRGRASSRIVVSVRAEGGFVEASVRDNGPGIEPGVRERIFEPFFTTKAPGRGTGLGLASAFAIVRDHDGVLACTSGAGQGATFTVRLPEAEPPASASPETPPARDAQRPERATVLVVDDEAPLRQVLGWILGDAGHEVLLASSAAEAREVAAGAPHVRVALVDRGMPGGLALEDLAALRAAAPGVKLVLHTGNEPPEDLSRAVDRVLVKPAVADVLLETIAELLVRPA